MKLDAFKRAQIFFDKITKMEKVFGHLEVEGMVDGSKVYALIRDSFIPVSDAVGDFKKSLDFMENVLENPAPLVLMFDLVSDRKDPSQSHIPPDPMYFLLGDRGVGKWYNILARLSGKIPLVATVFDRMGASSTFPVSMCDAVFMTENAGMSIGREDVVKKMLGLDTDYNSLGSASMHARISGSVDFVGKSEKEVLNAARNYISFFSGGEKKNSKSFNYSFRGDIKSFINNNPSLPMDMDGLILAICDDNSFFELKKEYAREVITGFARFEGMVAGIVANRSKVNGGLYFPYTCLKEAKFISLCDSFGIPVVFLADSAGFMIGSGVEQRGAIKTGALMLSVISRSRIPKLSIAVRRDYTVGVYATGGGHIANSRFVALPSALISIYSEKVGKLVLKEKKKKEAFEEMTRKSKNVYTLENEGYLHSVIDYSDLRKEIVNFLRENMDKNFATGMPVLPL